MRVSKAILIGEKARTGLQRKVRRCSAPGRVAVRRRIVLLAAEGLQNKQIAGRLKVSMRMTAFGRGRFARLGVVGLLKDARTPGRTPSIPAAVLEKVIAKTTQSTHSQTTKRSTRTMARTGGYFGSQCTANLERSWVETQPLRES